jgi:uncharacterized membrane protein (UPF0127 family)
MLSLLPGHRERRHRRFRSACHRCRSRPSVVRSGILIGLLALGLVALAAGVGCGGGDDSAVVVLRPEGRPEVSVRVELARTGQEHSRGLMFREHLDADAGMLFLYDKEDILRFWMRNTLIPLDMLFISADRQVVGIVENAEPQTDTIREVAQPSQYVLEVNGGFSAEHGITAGTPVEFRNVE